MKKIVIYDSFFNNTKLIAETIAKELECETLKVQLFNQDIVNTYDLIVVGSPTRAFSPTPDIKELVKGLKPGKTQVALFDTRVEMNDDVPKFLRFMAKKFGYSNDTLEKILRKKKVPILLYAEEFFVTGNEGPLLEGEVEKAKKFAYNIKKSMEKLEEKNE